MNAPERTTTGATALLRPSPTLEALKAEADAAWQAYLDVCQDKRGRRRAAAIEAARVAMQRLRDAEKRERVR